MYALQRGDLADPKERPLDQVRATRDEIARRVVELVAELRCRRRLANEALVANITLLPITFISGVFAPLHDAPRWLTSLASFFPLRHLVDAFTATFSPHTTGSGFSPRDLAVLVAWTVAGAIIAVRRFRWEPSQTRLRHRQREPHVGAPTR